MTLAEIIPQWPAIVSAVGGLGGGGLVVKILEDRRERHKTDLEAAQVKREQTDEVALDLVNKLTVRLEKVEADAAHEREICESRLSSLRHELRNVAANFDGLLLALKYASPERIQEIVADVLSRRHAAIQPIPPEPTHIAAA